METATDEDVVPVSVRWSIPQARNAVLPLVTTWMGPEGITLSEMSQRTDGCLPEVGMGEGSGTKVRYRSRKSWGLMHSQATGSQHTRCTFESG